MRGLLLVFACLTAHATAHAVPIFVETWSRPGSTAGFESWPSDSFSLSQDDGSLAWSFSPDLPMGLVQVGASASGGAFVGNVGGGHASYYAFDFRPSAGTSVSQLGMYIDSADGTWYQALSNPISGQWNHYRLPFVSGPNDWTLQCGPESLSETLGHVTNVWLEWGVAGGGGSGQLDNFEVGHTPEPATIVLLVGGFGALVMRRRASKAAKRTLA